MHDNLRCSSCGLSYSEVVQLASCTQNLQHLSHDISLDKVLLNLSTTSIQRQRRILYRLVQTALLLELSSRLHESVNLPWCKRVWVNQIDRLLQLLVQGCGHIYMS